MRKCFFKSVSFKKGVYFFYFKYLLQKTVVKYHLNKLTVKAKSDSNPYEIIYFFKYC